MKCQSLVSRKNKINITSLSSAESAHSVISVNAYLLCPVDISNLEVRHPFWYFLYVERVV